MDWEHWYTPSASKHVLRLPDLVKRKFILTQVVMKRPAYMSTGKIIIFFFWTQYYLFLFDLSFHDSSFPSARLYCLHCDASRSLHLEHCGVFFRMACTENSVVLVVSWKPLCQSAARCSPASLLVLQVVSPSTDRPYWLFLWLVFLLLTGISQNPTLKSPQSPFKVETAVYCLHKEYQYNLYQVTFSVFTFLAPCCTSAPTSFLQEKQKLTRWFSATSSCCPFVVSVSIACLCRVL